MRTLFSLLFAAFWLFGGATNLLAVERVALVIGNSEYSAVSRLRNPSADARALARKLRDMGFQKVSLHLNLGGSEMRAALGRFSREAAGADMALVYFAGHGMEVNGKNYLIPTDARLAHVDDVEFEAIELTKLMHSLNRAKKLKLVILDACRNNPFQNQMDGIGQTRAVGRGLARVNPSGSDTFVAYAAKEGTVAEDGDKGNSPYATALLKHIATPGLDVRLMFGRVRDEVRQTTGFRQEPYTYGSLPGERIFLADPVETVQTPVNEPAPAEIDREALFWSSVKDSNSRAVLSTYLKQYPDGQFADLARARIAELKVADQTTLARLRKTLKPPARPVEPEVQKPQRKRRKASLSVPNLASAESFRKLAEAQIWGKGQTAVNYRSAAGKYLELYCCEMSERAVEILEAGARDYPVGFRRAVQEELKTWGHYRGLVDGRLGPSTLRALKAYRAVYKYCR